MDTRQVNVWGMRVPIEGEEAEVRLTHAKGPFPRYTAHVSMRGNSPMVFVVLNGKSTPSRTNRLFVACLAFMTEGGAAELVRLYREEASPNNFVARFRAHLRAEGLLDELPRLDDAE